MNLRSKFYGLVQWMLRVLCRLGGSRVVRAVTEVDPRGRSEIWVGHFASHQLNGTLLDQET